MIGLLRHAAFFALTVAGCLIVTLGAAWLGVRRAPFERVDTVTASSLGADYTTDARSELSPPLLLGIIDAAAEDETFLAQPGIGERPRSESDAPSLSIPRALGTATSAAKTPAPTQVVSPTAEPTRPATPTAIPTQPSSPTSEPPTGTPVPPEPTDTPRPPTSTPIINLPCGLPFQPPNGGGAISRPTCTPTPTFTPKPISTPTPKLSPTPTRTPIIDLFPNDWPLVGDL